MKSLRALMILGLMLASPAYAQTAGQSVTGFLLAQGSTYGSFTCPSSATSPCFVQYGPSIPTTGGGSSDTPVSIDQTTPSTTNGVVTNAGSVTTATQGTPNAAGTNSWPVQGATAAGSPPAGSPVLVGGTDGTNTRSIITTSGGILLITPSPSATIGLTTQSCTAACASTIVSGAHALYDGSFSSTVTGWLLIYNATSCPANGTVTPEKAIAYTVANSTVGFSWGGLPMINGTGLAACFSSSGPYSATASTTAFISVDYK